MVAQLNIKFQDDFMQLMQSFSKQKGFLSVQEFIRQVVRNQIEEELQVRPEYIAFLQSKQANTFLSDKKSQKMMENWKKRFSKDERI